MSLGDAQLDVDEFHAVVIGQVMPTRPQLPDDIDGCRRLLGEEVDETDTALVVEDLPGIVDGCLDTIYIALGILSKCGVDAAPLWALVQEANLAKQGGYLDDKGKWRKPDEWKAPDVRGELIRQGWRP